MAKSTLTVRITDDVRDALDGIAAATDRDRSYVVNQALESYVDLHRWQVELIQRRVKEADAGDFVSEAEFKRTIVRIRKK